MIFYFHLAHPLKTSINNNIALYDIIYCTVFFFLLMKDKKLEKYHIIIRQNKKCGRHPAFLLEKKRFAAKKILVFI